MEQPTLFEELGGESVLRQIIDRFVNRVVTDSTIGVYFRNVNSALLKQREFEFAAQHLGAPIEYTGRRPLEEVHKRKLHLFDTQFARRLTLLKETLAEFRAPAHVMEHWIAHTEALKDQVSRGP